MSRRCKPFTLIIEERLISNHTTLTTIVQSALGEATAAEIALRPALEYQSNQLYDVWANERHYILKEFLKPDEQAVAPLREFRALERLAALDLAPQPVFYEPAQGPVVIYEYMEGVMWDRRRPTAAELAQLAEVWLAFNALPTADLWMSRGYERSLHQAGAWFYRQLQTYAQWADAECKPARPAAALCLELLQTRQTVADELTNNTPVLCFCRADTRFANVIQRPDQRLGLIDWEDSGLRDPARDLADLMTHPNQEDLLTPTEWQAFLQPYLAERSQLDPGLVQRFQLYLAIFPIFWLALGCTQGMQRTRARQLAGWTINGLPANVRLQRYLARLLAWPAVEFEQQLASLADLKFFDNDSELSPSGKDSPAQLLNE
ncbi:MAG: phosphotransferase [Caldilineaceae bacterium]